MDQRGPILKWKLSLAEAIGACGIVGSFVSAVMIYANGSFQSKDDASKMYQRIEKVESELSSLKNGVNQIAVDVSYIRGKLEPKNNKE